MRSKTNKFIDEEDSSIIKIVQVKSRDRITLPKAVRKRLKVDVGDHLVFCDGEPGVNMIKVTLDVITNKD
ncbi:MAG: AbrB/MazE/SpoVT family DNA-binding domain-containing protein [Elusimicrobiota bacterium]